MTALPRRRKRATTIAFIAAILGFAGAAGIGLVGVRSLADSTAGERAAGRVAVAQTQRLPFTSTALVGVADDDGRLTSAAVWVLDPNGVGGSIVAIAATADTSSGNRDVLEPLAAVYSVSGPEEFRASAEVITGLSFDVIEVVDVRRFAQLVSPLGDLPMLFPVAFADASSGDSWDAGNAELSPASAARAITAADPAVADWVYESARSAVWGAIADRIGAGVGSVTPIASDQDVPIPRNLDEFAERLFGAPVEFRALGFRPVDADRVGEQLPRDYAGALGSVDAVVAHDRAEIAIVFGAIAPARLGAPLDAPVFRVVAPFSDDDVADLDLNRTDVLKRAIDGLFFAQVNVVSVADISDEPVPAVTRLVIDGAVSTAAVLDTYEPLFGEIEIEPATVTIEGVDIEVTLGRSFLEHLRGESARSVAGSDNDADDNDDDIANG